MGGKLLNETQDGQNKTSHKKHSTKSKTNYQQIAINIYCNININEIQIARQQQTKQI